MAAKHRILIAGASGVVGAAAVEHFASLPDWQVVALSRRPVRLFHDWLVGGPEA